MSEPQMQEYTTEIRVRYSDCDPMGFLHHSRYFIYFEIARTEMYRACGGDYAEMERSGHFFVVVSAESHYRKPAHYDDVLQITVRLEKVTRVKLVHAYEVRCNGELLTEAKTTLAMVDREGRVVLIPDDLQI